MVSDIEMKLPHTFTWWSFPRIRSKCGLKTLRCNVVGSAYDKVNAMQC
jgi:hypothetical protein